MKLHMSISSGTALKLYHQTLKLKVVDNDLVLVFGSSVSSKNLVILAGEERDSFKFV